MKTIFTLAFTLMLSLHGHAQVNEEAKSKILAARIALITERLDLSPDQAEKFWPVYKQYLNQKQEIKNEFRNRLGGIDPKNATEEESKKVLELRLELKQRELSLEKDFSGRLLSVISSRQLVSLRQAEQEFRKRLMEMINNRQTQTRNQQEEQRRLNQQRLKKRRGN
ncbi:MAG: hypothetical protein WBA74_15665 [Cyclobacteriaceae bacterium]